MHKHLIAIDNVCVLQSAWDLHPVVASFLEIAREKIELFSSPSPLVSAPDSDLEIVAHWNKRLGIIHECLFCWCNVL